MLKKLRLPEKLEFIFDVQILCLINENNKMYPYRT